MSEFQRVLSSAKAGDEIAFGQLFGDVQPLLLRFLGTIGGPLAEDCAAETWVNVVRDLDRFKGDQAQFRAWVFTIGRRRVIDAQRRKGRMPEVLDPFEDMGVGEVCEVSATAFEQGEETRRALRLLALLPAEQRDAVFLRHVAGLDAKRAAEVLGRSPGSVRVATHRGLKRLAELLGNTSEGSSDEGV